MDVLILLAGTDLKKKVEVVDGRFVNDEERNQLK
jgi:hypothetical protein